MKWQAATGYGNRALIETAIGRYQALIGPRPRARSFTAQQTEVINGCTVISHTSSTVGQSTRGHFSSSTDSTRRPPT